MTCMRLGDKVDIFSSSAHIVLTTAQQVISCHWKDENGSTMYEKWKTKNDTCAKHTNLMSLFLKHANLWLTTLCTEGELNWISSLYWLRNWLTRLFSVRISCWNKHMWDSTKLEQMSQQSVITQYVSLFRKILNHNYYSVLMNKPSGFPVGFLATCIFVSYTMFFEKLLY